jgi:hypothetical protein
MTSKERAAKTYEGMTTDQLLRLQAAFQNVIEAALGFDPEFAEVNPEGAEVTDAAFCRGHIAVIQSILEGRTTRLGC